MTFWKCFLVAFCHTSSGLEVPALRVVGISSDATVCICVIAGASVTWKYQSTLELQSNVHFLGLLGTGTDGSASSIGYYGMKSNYYYNLNPKSKISL